MRDAYGPAAHNARVTHTRYTLHARCARAARNTRGLGCTLGDPATTLLQMDSSPGWRREWWRPWWRWRLLECVRPRPDAGGR